MVVSVEKIPSVTRSFLYRTGTSLLSGHGKIHPPISRGKLCEQILFFPSKSLLTIHSMLDEAIRKADV